MSFQGRIPHSAQILCRRHSSHASRACNEFKVASTSWQSPFHRWCMIFTFQISLFNSNVWSSSMPPCPVQRRSAVRPRREPLASGVARLRSRSAVRTLRVSGVIGDVDRGHRFLSRVCGGCCDVSPRRLLCTVRLRFGLLLMIVILVSLFATFVA